MTPFTRLSTSAGLAVPWHKARNVPVFFERNAAFVHLPRTAGTSVMASLAASGEAAFAGRGLWELFKQYADPGAIVRAVRENFYLTTLRDFPQQHLPASALRLLVGSPAWEQLYTFAFVRNPWDLVVSTFEFARRDAEIDRRRGADPDRVELIDRSPTFARFVELYPAMRSDMTSMLCDRAGQSLVTFVGRYEALDAGFATVCAHVGLRAALPQTNASERRDYRSYYDDRTRAVVERHFARDIERWGYVF